ncbi:MAG: dihydrofolate reductase [Patescibacteria group bacterium]|jgi:dihydrofolate reductase
MNKPIISTIVAVAEKNRAIGFKNKLLWHIPEDLQRFKKITRGHPVIMGQTTFESIGKPLPERTNIVMTLDKNFKAAGVTICYSLDEAIAEASKHDQGEIFFCGGATIYRLALPLTDRLYVTVVKGEYEADTFFPDYSEFTKIISRQESRDDKHEYTFFILEKSI